MTESLCLDLGEDPDDGLLIEGGQSLGDGVPLIEVLEDGVLRALQHEPVGALGVDDQDLPVMRDDSDGCRECIRGCGFE